MSAHTDARLEETTVVLNLLRSLSQSRIVRRQGRKRVREQSLVGKNKEKLVFFKNINLGDTGSFKDTSRNCICVLAIRNIDTVISTIKEFATSVCSPVSSQNCRGGGG